MQPKTMPKDWFPFKEGGNTFSFPFDGVLVEPLQNGKKADKGRRWLTWASTFISAPERVQSHLVKLHAGLQNLEWIQKFFLAMHKEGYIVWGHLQPYMFLKKAQVVYFLIGLDPVASK